MLLLVTSLSQAQSQVPAGPVLNVEIENIVFYTQDVAGVAREPISGKRVRREVI
jgi:hypothetical protein